jgi:hypothetical protein
VAYIGNRVVAGVGSAVKVDLDAPTNALRVKNNGRIGIGKSDPTVELDVAGTVKATAFQGDGSALTGIESLPAAIDVNGSAPDDSLAIDSAGNVGIGTTSPSTLLHLKSAGPAILTLEADSDNAIESDNARIELSQDGGVVTGHMGYDTNANGISIWNNYGDYVRFGTNDVERMRIDSGGDVLPGANGTQDLGSTSLRWANIYTSDLHLNNGIGNYTIVEGEEDLFLYNNKNGKTYKFVLAEVDPSEAPKKMEK